MKTAISIPDAEFEAAEKLAGRLGLSRSELYRRAVGEFLARHSDEAVTEKLNEVHGAAAETAAGLGLDEALAGMQEESLPKDRW
ncbi:MAG: ribbon-helix-helix domain-containing protein [Rhodospirillales bacterium]|nr:ribbon-helix-helix domain-containing protein [Rhodospirillales bacterium]